MEVKMKRVILLVLDSVGIGALPDAGAYQDAGADTLGHIAAVTGGLHLVNLEKLGLGKIAPLPGVAANGLASGGYGKLAEQSAGKDTTTGHWEIAGIIKKTPFPTYPQGFPTTLMEQFSQITGKGVLGNKPASGTAIIEELGAAHLKTGKVIVYTSADSVLQIAAHEAVVPLEELYDICQKAREMLVGEHAVGRVIARPFTGAPGSFKRTANRRDFSLDPPEVTMLDRIKQAGYAVMGVGKISDIYNGRGITESRHTTGNMDSVAATLRFMKSNRPGLIFANLVEFDMNYGHRRDVTGYAAALRDFDLRLPELMDALRQNEVLMITADHGCDPTWQGTDHTREYTPLLVYGPKIKPNVNLGIRKSFADIAATITELLAVEPVAHGESFARQILQYTKKLQTRHSG
jgi:phosphopentomutase